MSDKKFKIGFFIFPGMTQLDFTGPAEVLGMMPDAEVVVVAKTMDSVRASNKLAFLPDRTIDDEDVYDMICVAGGVSCTDVMTDKKTLNWLRRQAETAQYVTSVCTGSLILAAAGLLEGRRAGCHWAWIDHLEKFGATPVRERVVTDGNRITAGGVTAGIDFGFRIVEQRLGRDMAETLLLGIEYDPAPLSGGIPETARPEIVKRIRDATTPETRAKRAEVIGQAACAYETANGA
ncbi:MAG: DJ-1/PfpI family protein [Parasphingorhabdus sp.]|uniref:DJ-1/PfpI family protein n=1 Tax=Parasphingorhabdus sp. TaxID=2709688 RepID=UPI003299EA63